MMKRILLSAGLVAVLAGGSVVAMTDVQQGPGAAGPARERGRGPGPRGGGPGDLGLRGIDLNDAQREQVRSITESHRAELNAVNTKLREAHRAFAAAARAEVVDEAAVRASSTAVANAMGDEAIVRAKIRTEVQGILTAEQLQTLKERQSNIERRLQERGQQRQPRRPA